MREGARDTYDIHMYIDWEMTNDLVACETSILATSDMLSIMPSDPDPALDHKFLPAHADKTYLVNTITSSPKEN